MSSKRRKQEPVEPDFTLFDSPQTGYNPFEGLNIEELTRAATPPLPTPEDLPAAESLNPLDEQSKASQRIAPSHTPALSTQDIAAEVPSRKPPKQRKQTPTTSKPVFVLKSDWELLLSPQQFSLLEFLVGLNSSEIWIQGSTIEQETGIPLPTIKRSIALFKAKKFIKKIQHKFSGGERHSILHLNTPLCQEALNKNRLKYNISDKLT